MHAGSEHSDEFTVLITCIAFTVLIALLALCKAQVVDMALKESVEKLTAEAKEMKEELRAALRTINEAFSVPDLRTAPTMTLTSLTSSREEIP